MTVTLLLSSSCHLAHSTKSKQIKIEEKPDAAELGRRASQKSTAHLSHQVSQSACPVGLEDGVFTVLVALPFDASQRQVSGRPPGKWCPFSLGGNCFRVFWSLPRLDVR